MALLSRYIILFLFLFFAEKIAAQSDTAVYRIKWRKPVSLVINNKYKQILSFELAEHKPENQFLPSVYVVIKGEYSHSFEITDAEWINLSEQDLKSLPESYTIESQPKTSLYNSQERANYNTKIEIVPFRKNAGGTLEKLAKFQLKLNRTAPPVTTTENRTQKRLSAVENSVLAQGDWFKLSFLKTGIYKIDYKYIKSLGLNPEEINTANLQIWGNGGGMLPEKISQARLQDLSQTAIFFSDGNDGKFNENDYILLYVQGPDVWKLENNQEYFTYSKHLYSKTSSYFLIIGSSPGKRISNEPAVSGNPDVNFSTYTSRFHHESENINFLSSGRNWYGEEFDNNSTQNFNIPANGVTSGSQIYVSSSFMNKSNQALTVNSFNVSVNNVPVSTYSLSGGGAGIYDRVGTEGKYTDQIPSDNFAFQKNLQLTVRYNKNAGVGTGYLNYFTVNFEDDLLASSSYMDFRHLKSRNKGLVQYSIKMSSTLPLRVWDVTDISDVSEPYVTLTANTALFKYVSDENIGEFISFTGSDFPSPSEGIKITNQNIRGNNTPDLLIVTHPLFKNEANKLADFRRQHDKFDVVVATTEEIYNEFSSGNQDLVAIRDCARMFYTKPENSAFEKFKYILLFGDCSFDYKNIKSLPSPSGFIPVYESEESLSPTETYSSDDYVGLLSESDGQWDRDDDLDVGVGRIPIQTAEQGAIVVQKIIHYSTSTSTLGGWRQNLTFIADNEEGNEFLDNAESLSSHNSFLIDNYNSRKIYIAAYNKDFSGGAPGASSDIAEEFNNGTFIMNYIGHGGEFQLASENVINLNTIGALKNYDKLPFMVTATCDFGKYDDPTLTSGGELFLLSQYGGAIGLLCTTRPVFHNYNKRINAAFYNNAFTEEAKESLRLGDLILRSKNNSKSGAYNRNFALLGDPSLRLSYPQNNIAITKINGQEFKPYADTLKAQSKITLSGNITKNGNIITDFNGVINSLIFDKVSVIETVDEPKASFEVRDSKIFDGSATVKNGEFSFTFIVPKNINYIVGPGKISLYANAENGRIIDAGGGDSEILVGSGERNVARDNTPPEVKAYLNDESFVQGAIINENPLLIVKLSDENGISSIRDVGGSITAIINDQTNNEKNLNNYYKSDRDTYKSGTINYRLTPADGVKEGNNKIKITAFDSNRNGIENGGLLEFVVAKKESLTIKNLLNYPNPFTTRTVFHFDHNRAGDDLEVLIQIYTITGKLVKTLGMHTPSASTHISDLVWDGKDDFGDNIGRGVYVYKLSVKALSDGFKKDEYQKLVILN